MSSTVVTLLIYGLGVALGWLLVREHYRARAWEWHREAVATREMLRELCLAADQVVGEMEAVGEDAHWKDGDQTDRVYAWYEIEPLARALRAAEERLYPDERL